MQRPVPTVRHSSVAALEKNAVIKTQVSSAHCRDTISGVESDVKLEHTNK